MIEPLFARALNWTRLRVLDVDAALWKLRWRLHRMRSRPWPLFVVVALVLTACAPMQARRTIARIDARCSAAYERATTTEEVDAIHDRCDAAYEEVRHGE